MKLKEFRKKMAKPLFLATEAQLVCLPADARTTNLQLHQWKESGDLIPLKRGLYMFADAKPQPADIAGNLYAPCYFSLEYALSFYGIMPEAVFDYTLVTPKATRVFKTPFGTFLYKTIKRAAFTGFDGKTLMAEKEKALVDYFYLNQSRLRPDAGFWAESRLEVKTTVFIFKKAFAFARLFHSKKLLKLLISFESYAKTC
jgi:hypothetical protein